MDRLPEKRAGEMSLTIELSPQVEQQLRAEAARKGQAPEEFVRTAVEKHLASVRQERHGSLAELMRQWREEPPDLEEAEGYPEKIERLRLREISIDP
jgi:hypothetical protein